MRLLEKIKNYLLTCWKFRQVLSEYQSWDSGYIEKVAAAMYRDMGTYIQKRNYFVKSQKVAKRALIIAHLLDYEVEMTPYHCKLLDKWWYSRKETDIGDGLIRLDFEDNLTLRRRLDKERIKHDARIKQRNDMLLSYISKYHSRIWD